MGMKEQWKDEAWEGGACSGFYNDKMQYHRIGM